eukprot:TRINITY_DN5458_c0_g2_i1.p1 TRINITY_DN5458_c0_g2~~TRINITY_DN5458_c0_g2_i1.p1  ORF type:complete len:247 (+),score=32.60 TRINITY_DN5458_c0_g2_i1:55-795(+)
MAAASLHIATFGQQSGRALRGIRTPSNIHCALPCLPLTHQGRFKSPSKGTEHVQNSFSAKRRLVTQRFRSRAISAALDVFILGYEGTLADIKDNALYAGVADALRETGNPFYVVASSSTDRRRVSGDLSREAEVDIPEDSPRIVTSDRRLEAWKKIQEKPIAQDPTNTIHVVDSDWTALREAEQDPDLSGWQLYWASWSGSGAKEENGATRIRKARLEEFPELLRWGLLMGVNDGCQEYEDGSPAA